MWLWHVMATLYNVHNEIAWLGLKGRVHHDGDRKIKVHFIFVPILKLLLLFAGIFGEIRKRVWPQYTTLHYTT